MAEKYLGQREQIAWVYEDGGYATLTSLSMAADGEVIGKNATLTPDESQGWQENLSAGADTREVEGLELGPLQHRFTLNFSPVNWKFLQFCVHGSVSNGGGSPNWTHTFTASDAVDSFTLEWAKRGTTNEVETYTGCIIKRMRFRWAKGTGDKESFLTVEAECLAKSKSKGTSVTSVSALTLKAFKFHSVKWTYASSEFVELNSGNFLMDNGIQDEDSRYANSSLSRTIAEPIPRKISYLLTMNINQSDATFTDDWIAGTNVAGTHTLEFIRDGANDKLTLTFTDLFVISPNNSTNLDGISTQDLVLQPLSTAPLARDQIETYFA